MGRTGHRVSHGGLQQHFQVAVLPVSGNAGAPFGCQYTKEVVVVGMKKVLDPPPPRLTRCCSEP